MPYYEWVEATLPVQTAATGTKEDLYFRGCETLGIPVQATAKKPYSMDRNLLHISFEAGILEDPWYDASAEKAREMYVLSVSPEEAADKAEYVELTFERGNCTAVGYHNNGTTFVTLAERWNR